AQKKPPKPAPWLASPLKPAHRPHSTTMSPSGQPRLCKAKAADRVAEQAQAEVQAVAPAAVLAVAPAAVLATESKPAANPHESFLLPHPGILSRVTTGKIPRPGILSLTTHAPKPHSGRPFAAWVRHT